MNDEEFLGVVDFRLCLAKKKGDYDAAERRFLSKLRGGTKDKRRAFARRIRNYVAELNIREHYATVLGPDQTIEEYHEELAALERLANP